MIDIKKIREDFDSTVAQLARRGVEQEKVAKARDLDAKRRTLLAETETLKAKRNAASKEIGALAKSTPCSVYPISPESGATVHARFRELGIRASSPDRAELDLFLAPGSRITVAEQ